MPKETLTAYKAHRYDRSNSIHSHKPGAAKSQANNAERASTKANTSKYRQPSVSPPKARNKGKKAAGRKEQSKILTPSRKLESRDGFAMTNSVNIPHLSPASHSEFTRNNSLQFTTHFGEQSLNMNPLS
jgi:hypothetical protein